MQITTGILVPYNKFNAVLADDCIIVLISEISSLKKLTIYTVYLGLFHKFKKKWGDWIDYSLFSLIRWRNIIIITFSFSAYSFGINLRESFQETFWYRRFLNVSVYNDQWHDVFSKQKVVFLQDKLDPGYNMYVQRDWDVESCTHSAGILSRQTAIQTCTVYNETYDLNQWYNTVRKAERLHKQNPFRLTRDYLEGWCLHIEVHLGMAKRFHYFE